MLSQAQKNSKEDDGAQDHELYRLKEEIEKLRTESK
jgi:hypothetical protein